MKRSFSQRLWLLATLLVGSGAASAQTLVQWTAGTGANNHYYQLVITSTTWVDANTAAQSTGGYLATITSAEENAFVFDHLASLYPSAWFIDGAGNNQGPALGGLQTSFTSEPAGGWAWVTGETWDGVFTPWAGGGPNNYGGNENYLQFFGFGSAIDDLWNDIPGNSHIASYLVEFDTSPIPEPSTTAIIVGAVSLVVVGCRRRSSKEVSA